MEMMLSNIIRNGKWGRISNNKHAMINVLSACILNGEKTNQLSDNSMGKQAGLSKGFIWYNKDKSIKKARLINKGDERGLELI